MNDKNTAGIDLDKLEELVRTAKASTWTAVKHNWSNVGIYYGGRPVACLNIIDDATEETQDALEADMDADAAFMVAACNALPALIDLARRAEPSVTKADERALFVANQRRKDSIPNYITDDMIMKGEITQHEWAGWQARAALASPAVADDRPVAEFADDFIFCLRKQPNGEPWPKGTKLYVRPSPAVSQKDGEADCTEPNREACPRLCGDFCNAAEEARAATTTSAGGDEARTVIANLASVVRAQNGNRHADINELLARAEKCLAPAPSRDAAPKIKTWQERADMREFIMPKDAVPHMVAEIDDLRAAIERAAIAAHLARQAQQADRDEAASVGLHNAIMNLPCKRADHEFMNAEHRMLYKNGHRDARHAAAELALAPASQEGAHAALDEVRNQALEEVAKLIDKKVESYSNEHGRYDHTTGVTEYPGDGAEWVCEMDELAEEIRALKTPASAERSGDHG